MLKKVVRINSAIIRKVIAMILLVIVLSFGAYSITASSFTSWLTEPFVTQTKDSSERQTNNNRGEDRGASNTEKSEDGKVDGDMNDHTSKDSEDKETPIDDTEHPDNRTDTKHDDSAKSVDTNPAIVVDTIAKFISIMGLFAALTYYFEKIFLRKKKQ